MNTRQAVLRILTSFDRQPWNFERNVDAVLNAAPFDSRDKRFVFEIAYGIVRRRLTLDYIIDRFLTSAGLRKKAVLRRILQIGLYQIIYLDRVPDHAAVNESVKLAKTESETRELAGIVNGVLRKVAADRRAALRLPGPETPLAERLSIEYSHPPWMIERWLESLGLASVKQLLAFNNERPVSYLRRRMHGLSRQQFEAENHALCEPAGGYLNLYYRLKKNIAPENVHAVRQGLCAFQAPSSGWVTALMEADKGERILDLCASPGGKMSMLAEIVGESGSVCACDGNWQRVRTCVTTARRMHLDNVHVLAADGRFPPFDGEFDKVLVDAPCTCTGVFQRHPDARWIRKPGDIGGLVSLQSGLLDSAAPMVRPGGRLVYSTCSLEPEENGGQIASFLERHPEFVHRGCPGAVPQNFVDEAGFLSITPFAHGMDGMFGACLERVQ
jgi:16S rRNA (cytosine967-C5)-methyltransferase